MRFDGVRATPWQPPSGQQLPGSLITSLLAARDGTLWIGTFAGVASWKGGKLRQVPELDGQSVTSVLETRDGAIWIGIYAESGGGLCEVHSGVVHCERESGKFGTGVKALYEDSKGALWLGLQNGLWRWKPGTPEFFSVPDEPVGIIGFAEDEEGHLLFGSHAGVRRLVDGLVEPYPPGSAYRWQVTRMLRDHEGGLWVGTSEHGLIHIHEKDRTDIFSHTDGLSGDYVTRFLEDREGSIWVATFDGVDHFRAYAVPTISTKQGLSSTLAWSVLASKDGSVWIATSSALNHWKNGYISLFGSRGGTQKSDGKLNGEPPEGLFQDSSGKIWVSTPDGQVGYLQDDRFIPIHGVPRGGVHSITEVPSGHLWVAHQNAGLLHLFQGRVLQQIPWARFGHSDFAKVLVADPLRRGLWLGFNRGGIAYFADITIRAAYAAGTGLAEGQVTDLRFGSHGALWVAAGTGLSRVQAGHVTTLSTKNGLPCGRVVAAIEDNDHSMWLYLACGLVRITQSELDAWVVDPNRVLNLELFGTSDGVRGHVTPGGYQPLMTKSVDGKIWFLPWDGVSVIDPRHIPFNKLPPPVHIEQIIADGKSYDAASGLRLPPLVRDLDIDYTGLSFVAPEKVMFRYKLEGWDRDWQNVGNRRQAFYTHLAPGHYRFRVTACNNSGVWNEQGAVLDFAIAPAYWQTNWFRALCVLAFLALVYGAYRLRLRELRQREQKFREAIESIPAMAFTALPDGSRTFVNRRWVEYTGLTVDHAAGQGWQAVIHPDDLKRVREKWRGAVATGEPMEYEARGRAADGEYRSFLVRAVPVRDKRGSVRQWCGVMIDIEDRKRAEQDRERLRTDLAHMNRVSIMGELSASLSHELKQPIAATITSANAALRWLQRDQPNVERACETTARIIKDGTRATDIIDRLRSLYKKSPPKRELIDVNEIVSELVSLLRGEANLYAVSVRTDLAAEVPKITADRVQIQQVLMNLMLNGIEAMKETGGVLSVKTQLQQDGRVLISVSDTGVGLPAEQAEQIFNAFFTTKPQGSGMGLAISRTIVESHGGRLWASANDGRGATFHFTLPVAAEVAQMPAGGP